MTVDRDATVDAAASGDPAALRQIWDLLAPRVRGFVAISGAEDPDGLTNEVFLAVFAQLGRVTGGWDGVEALTFTIARARAVDDVRRRTRRLPTRELRAEDDSPRAPSAEAEALDRVAIEELRDVLGLLPEQQREVLVLRVLGSLTVAQTAQAVGRSEAAVKKLHARALASLRQWLAADHPSRVGHLRPSGGPGQVRQLHPNDQNDQNDQNDPTDRKRPR